MGNKTKKELQAQIKEQSEHIYFLEHTIEYMYDAEQVIDLIASWNCKKCMYMDVCDKQDISRLQIHETQTVEETLKNDNEKYNIRYILDYDNEFCKKAIKEYLFEQRHLSKNI